MTAGLTGLPWWHVDAFGRGPFTGNQAGVVLLDDWPDDALLQSIAEECRFAETAFVAPLTGEEADWELRWFTPEMEIRLCGHATLAAGHVLLSSDEERDTMRFRTRLSGILDVVREGEDYALALPAIATAPTSWPEAAAAMGGDPAETWRSDLGYTILLYADESAVRALDPDMRALAALGSDLFIATAPGATADVASRVFAPGAGIPEDSATGSAHAALAPFWAARLNRATFSAFQTSARGGWFDCRLDGERALLRGACVTVVEGRFLL